MRNLVLSILIASFAATVPAAAQVSNLRARVSVEGPFVTLADLFGEFGKSGDIIAARAPLPGERKSVSIDHINAVLRKHDLDWRRTAPPARVLIVRESRKLPRPEIEAQIADALRERGAPDYFALRFVGRVPEIHVGLLSSEQTDIASIVFDDRTNRFKATLAVYTEEQGTRKFDFIGHIRALARVPVLTETVGMGQRVTETMLSWAEVPAVKLPRDAILDIRSIAGMEAQRTIRAGQPVRSNAVAKPNAVERGALITIVFRRPGLELATTARALDSGAVNDIIRVRNVSSKQVREVRIVGPELGEANPAPVRTAAHR